MSFKNIYYLLFLLFLSGYAFAQITPNGKTVSSQNGSNLDPTAISAINYMVDNYYNVEVIQSSQANHGLFNCHFYAWNNTQGYGAWSQDYLWKNGSPSSKKWVNYPIDYYNDQSYSEPSGYVSYVSTTSSSAEICVYTAGGTVTHSARRLTYTNDVISKWGAWGIYKHARSECPDGRYMWSPDWGSIYASDYGNITAYYKINPKYRPVGSGDPGGRDWGTISNALVNISSGSAITVFSGTQTLSENITIPSGVTLTIKSGATVNLNGYYLKTTGGTITNNGTVNPDVWVEQSGTLKGYYPSISSAVSNASSGQTIRVASGTYNENSITVPSGILLDIYTDNPSVIINFSSGSNLTVNGELKANDVTFKGQGSGTSYWSGIYVTRKAIITYSNIRNASYGVKTTSCLSSTTISYNEFRDCTNGIVCYSGGSPTINSNDFYNIQNAAIALNSTPANAQYNDVFQSNQSSVLMTSITTSGDFNHNRIFSSGLHGIWIGGYSNIQIENCSIERCNNGACVNITSTATPSVTPGNTIERIGYWSIYNGNANHCVNALNNTWVNMLNYGCVDTDDKDLPDKGDDGKDLFALGTDYYANGKYEHALGTFKNLILDYSDSDYARDAFTYIMRIFESTSKPDAESIHYFEDLKKDLSAKGVKNLMSAFVDLHILYWLQRNDLFDETEKKYDELLTTLTEDEFQTELKFGKAVFYIYEKNEPEKAAPLLADVAKSESILSGIAQMELADIGGQPYASSGDPELPGSALISNFPNPFNPDTHIKYRINNPSSVQIVIYDILGRKIKTLVDNHQAAGIHDVRWDGTDYNGVNVASGMYFYKLICNDFVDVKKMLLLR